MFRGRNNPNSRGNIQSITEDCLAAYNEERQRYAAEQAASAERHQAERIAIWDDFLRFCRPARVEDYLPWLEGYVRKNGHDKVRYLPVEIESTAVVMSGGIGPEGVTLAEDKDERLMADNAIMFVLISRPTSIPVAFGSNSFQVIVPSGLSLPTVPEVGHSEFYYMDDFTTNAHWVNIFRDVAARILPGMP
jgi:hypothetical protein